MSRLSVSPPAQIAIWVVALHLLISILHGAAHLTIPVPLTLLEVLYIILIIGLAPILGAILLIRRQYQYKLLLSVAMAAALLFGLAKHFLLPGADNVAEVPPGAWQGIFWWTAVGGLSITEVAGVVTGLVAIRPRFLAR